MHIAILTDFPAVTYANGPSLATQALKRYLEARGHRVTLVGPKPRAGDAQAPEGSVLLEAVDFRAHDGVRLPFAWPPEVFENSQKFDVIHSHATSLLMHWAPAMRVLHGIPSVSTNTIYLPSFAQHVLPEALYKVGFLRERLASFAPAVEASFTRTYNAGDGLIVQCSGLERYWRQYGLEVPLHVIPRPIDPVVFDAPLGDDPFPAHFAKGGRIVSVGRHAREKDIHKLLHAFRDDVLPAVPEASLTLVGDGMEHRRLVRLAHELGVQDRVDFPGEKAHKELRHYYGHADIFGYASLSETYGQVISEALWCGVPVVALDDEMGVAFQVEDGVDGLLVPPGAGELAALGKSLASLLRDPSRRQAMGDRAAVRARQRVSPDAIYARYEQAYAAAIAHRDAHPPEAFSIFRKASWRRLAERHLVPWTTLQTLAVTLGAFREGAKSYTVPKGAHLDALPETNVQPQEKVATPMRAPHPHTHGRPHAPHRPHVRPVRDPYPSHLPDRHIAI